MPNADNAPVDQFQLVNFKALIIITIFNLKAVSQNPIQNHSLSLFPLLRYLSFLSR